MIKKILLYGILLLTGLGTGHKVTGQVFPATANVQLIPPHSLYLSDYYSPTAGNLKVRIIFNDTQEPFWEVKLRMRIESNNVSIRTKEGYTPPQTITVTPGIPLTLSGSELEDYFDYNHINVQGISVQSLQQNGRLPEGLYTFCFEVLDYNTGKVLSQQFCARAWLKLSDPPRIISPTCGAQLSPLATQHIFQWQLFNTKSPNSMGMEYKLFVYEMLDPTGNPLTALINGNFLQVFESDYLQTPYYIYDLAAPPLEPGKRYFYRVQAIDPNGKDSFKNNGFSEVCSFYYGYPEGGKIELLNPPSGTYFDKSAQPKFQWTAPDNKKGEQSIRYIVEVVKKNEGQSAEEAFEQNNTLVTKKMQPTVSFQDQSELIDHFDIQNSTSYLWRVRACTNNREIARSTISSFSGFSKDEGSFSRDEKILVKNSKKGEKPDIIEKTLGCYNAGVEENNFTKWTGSIGNYTGAKWWSYNNVNSGLKLWDVTLGSTNRISIVTSGQDLNCAPVKKVYKGNYAIRLGDEVPNKQAERVIYSLLVTDKNKFFKYNYAVILKIPSNNRFSKHSDNQKPFFWARILYNGQIICETGRKTSGTGDDFFKKHGTWEYRNWDCISCDLSGYKDKIVQVEFTVAGCSKGGHAGYAYIDGLCDEDPINLNFNLNKEVYCPEEDIILDGSHTIGATRFKVAFEESDENGGRPNPESEIIFPWQNQSPGKLNLTQLANNSNYSFKCNTYYRIKLAASNNCTPWKEETQLIYIDCLDFELQELYCLDKNCQKNAYTPPIGGIGTNFIGNGTGTTNIIGNDGRFIPTKANELIIDPKNPKNYTYTWSPSAGLSATDVPNPIHTIGSVPYPVEYTVVATDNYGCSVSKTVKINCELKAVRFSTIPSDDCCTTRLQLTTAGNYNSITWSNGATNVDYIDVTESGSYSATISNECNSYTTHPLNVTANKDKYPRYWTDLNNENNYSFVSSKDNANSYNKFFIKHDEDPNTPYGEYYATEYRLEIYRWLNWWNPVRVIEGILPDCKDFNNPEIFWDGKKSNGIKKPGSYFGRLYLKNCKNKSWTPVKMNQCTKWKRDCIAYTECRWRFFGESCGNRKKRICIKYGTPYCIQEKKEYQFPIRIL